MSRNEPSFPMGLTIRSYRINSRSYRRMSDTESEEGREPRLGFTTTSFYLQGCIRSASLTKLQNCQIRFNRCVWPAEMAGSIQLIGSVKYCFIRICALRYSKQNCCKFILLEVQNRSDFPVYDPSLELVFCCLLVKLITLNLRRHAYSMISFFIFRFYKGPPDPWPRPGQVRYCTNKRSVSRSMSATAPYRHGKQRCRRDK